MEASGSLVTKIASVQCSNLCDADFEAIISCVWNSIKGSTISNSIEFESQNLESCSNLLAKTKQATIPKDSAAIKSANVQVPLGCFTKLRADLAPNNFHLSTKDEKNDFVSNEKPPARQLPFDGMRKERCWFYFFMHSQRIPIYKKVVKIVSDDPPAPDTAIKSKGLERWLSAAPPLACKKSRVHRVGVFTSKAVAKNAFIAEYCGEIIRNILVENREKTYRKRNLGSYMFKLDESLTIDSTLKGGMARFVNHSCEPNCFAKVIFHNGRKKIVLVASRSILVGEEIFYDYKMPTESEKIPCLCGSRFCRTYLN